MRQISDKVKKKKVGVLLKPLLNEAQFTRNIAVGIKCVQSRACNRNSDVSPGNYSMGMWLKWATVKAPLWIHTLMTSGYL